MTLEGGADIRYVQQMLGHADISSTQTFTRISLRALGPGYAEGDPVKRTVASRHSPCSTIMAVEEQRGLAAASGRLEVRPDEHAALVDGKPLSLTTRELQLLTTLAASPQRSSRARSSTARSGGGAQRREFQTTR